jgi:hypothetical protein
VERVPCGKFIGEKAAAGNFPAAAYRSPVTCRGR